MPDVGRIEPHQGAPGYPRPGRRDRGELDRGVTDLARRQDGMVGRAQLLRRGVSRHAIAHRLRGSRWREIHPGVYFVGAHLPSARGRRVAALLATQPSSLLSHTSAVAEHQVGREGSRVHVTVCNRSPRKLEGVVVHRPRHLDPAEVPRINGLPVTTLSRTLLDIAETEPFHRFEKVFEEADRRRLLDVNALRATAERNPGRRGLKPFLALLESYFPSPDAEEGLEREFQLLLRAEGLPLPQVNVVVARQRVDCYWPSARFVVELDSRAYHSNWAARERDMVRDAHLLRIGIVTLRVTWRRMREERSDLVTDLWAHASREPLLR